MDCIRSDFWKYIGPAFLIAMGCVDPGNISGDIATGQITRYRLLWLLVATSVLFYMYQSLCIHLGVHTGRDITYLCHTHYSFRWCVFLYVMAEIALLAADTQEVLGTAIAFNILFGIDYWVGIVFALLSAYLFLHFQNNYSVRFLHISFVAFILIMVFCFGFNFLQLPHSYSEIALGFFPFMKLGDLPYAISMMGSIIMPQSIFLHSALVAEARRKYEM